MSGSMKGSRSAATDRLTPSGLPSRLMPARLTAPRTNRTTLAKRASSPEQEQPRTAWPAVRTRRFRILVPGPVLCSLGHPPPCCSLTRPIAFASGSAATASIAEPAVPGSERSSATTSTEARLAASSGSADRTARTLGTRILPTAHTRISSRCPRACCRAVRHTGGFQVRIPHEGMVACHGNRRNWNWRNWTMPEEAVGHQSARYRQGQNRKRRADKTGP